MTDISADPPRITRMATRSPVRIVTKPNRSSRHLVEADPLSRGVFPINSRMLSYFLQVFALDLSNGTSSPVFQPAWSAATSRALQGIYSTEMYTAALKRVLDGYVDRTSASNAPPAPLLLYIAPNNVHTPVAAPQRFVDHYNTSVASQSRREFSGDVSSAVDQ